MKLLITIQSILKNKVILYAITRYIILFISFVTSILLAAKLGPYYYGIWGFMLLIINYYQYFDFGISDSATIILVQNKNNFKRVGDYETNSFFLSSILSVLVILIAAYYALFGISFFEKYNLGNLFYFVSVVAILTYFNKLLFKIYRVKGKMFEFSFYQSINTILVFVVIFFAREKELIYLLILAYILGHFLSLFFFIRGAGVNLSGRINHADIMTILYKGGFLFLYNFLFYLIILSTKTIISVYYSVEEFGYFTFSYTLASAILVILDAFAVLVIPKVIDKLYSSDASIIESTIRELKVNYVMVSYGMLFIALIIYSVLLYFLPKYNNTFQVINMLSIAVVLSANSFGYSMYLKANNKEKILAKISLISLLVNVVFAIILVKVIEIQYSFVALSIMLSYFLFAYLCIYYAKKEMSQHISFIGILSETIPSQVIIPTLLIIIITIFDIRELIFIPSIIYIVLNIKYLKEILFTAKRIVSNSEIFDIK